MIDQYKYVVSITGALDAPDNREVHPLNVRTMRENFTLIDNDRRFAFQNAIQCQFIFNNDNKVDGVGDFTYFLGLNNSINRCRFLTLFILQRCGGSDEPNQWRTCRLRLIDGKYDEDNCTLTISVTPINLFTCFDDQKSRDLNLFDGPIPRVKARVIIGGLEFIDYTSDEYDRDDPDEFGGVDPRDLGYVAYKITYTTDSPHYHFYYGREVVAAGASPGAEWIDIGGGNWARPLTLTDYTRAYPDGVTPGTLDTLALYFGGEIFICNYFGGDSGAAEIDNGMLVTDIIAWIASSYCGLQFKSIFFTQNGETDFATTYPDLPDHTGQFDIYFQKSDVKRAGAQNNATRAITTAEKFIKNICEAYNLYYFIEGNFFRMEHASYFPRPQTIDLTIDKYRRRLVGTKKYSYTVEKIPRFEKFKWMEAKNPDFVGTPIEYVGDCVSQIPSGQDKLHDLGDLSTDLEYILQNSDPDSNKVSDEGFAMICCKFIDPDYIVQSAAPYLEGTPRLNGVLSWAYLHDKFHRHDRLQKNGYMNDEYTEFSSWLPNKKRDKITIRFCCDDAIELTGKVATDIGDAVIGAATFNPYEEELELELLYQDIYGNASCIRIKRFTFVEVDGSTFTFNTVFETVLPGPFQTEIQVLMADGTTLNSIVIDGDVTGNLATEFPFGFPDGVYKFRKRIICDVNYRSDWTDWISVAIGDVGAGACDNLESSGISSITFLTHNSVFAYVKFRFVPEYLGAFQMEVTRPDAAKYLVEETTITNGPGYQDVTFRLRKTGFTSPPFHGEYIYRFRRVCDAARGIYSTWTPPISVILP